jgi:hypothetical protein
MNADSKTALPWLSIILLVVLLGLVPYAMTFAPYGPDYLGGTLQMPNGPDSLYPVRVALILFGLVATVVALTQFVRTFRRAPSRISAVPSFAVFFACAVVGWRSIPYWVMGVFQVSLGAFPPRDQDPKGMIPMTWMSEFWRLPVLSLSLLGYVVLPGLVVLAGMLLWRRQFGGAVITASCASVALGFMLGFSPEYLSWLMD